MKRSFALLLTSVMLVVSLAACGKDRVDGAGDMTDGTYDGAGDMANGARDAVDDMGDAARDVVRGAEDALTGGSNHETSGYTYDQTDRIG